jgi:hypothetical protein
MTPLTKNKRKQHGNGSIFSSYQGESGVPIKEPVQPPTPFQTKHNRVPRSPLGDYGYHNDEQTYSPDTFRANGLLSGRRSSSHSPHSGDYNPRLDLTTPATPSRQVRSPQPRKGSLAGKRTSLEQRETPVQGSLQRGSHNLDASGRTVAFRGNKVFANEDQSLGSHQRTLADAAPSRGPPSQSFSDDEINAPGEGLSQYYKAFQSRSRLGRTPYTGSTAAERNEFPRIPLKTSYS